MSERERHWPCGCSALYCQEHKAGTGPLPASFDERDKTKALPGTRLITDELWNALTSGREELVAAVTALDPAVADDQPYGAWDAAKWRVFNAAVKAVRGGPFK